jgi:hypothetical protein
MLKKICAFVGVLAVICGIGTTTATTATASDTSSVTTVAAASLGLTSGQANAVRAAKNYLSFAAFSRSGLIGQLRFDGYSLKNATFAVDYITVSWKRQAARKAKSYLSFAPFSLSGLIGQLEFDGFTHRQAVYGANVAL